MLWETEPHDRVERVVPSPDGALIAINVTCEEHEHCEAFERPNTVHVFDVATGEELLRFPQTDATPDFAGTAAPIGWRDGHVALGGHFHRDFGFGDAALLSIDGDVVATFEGFRIAFDRALGRPHIVYSDPELPCQYGGYAGVTRIAAIDSESGEELTAIEADAPVLEFWGRSPDDAEWLIAERLMGEDDREWLRGVIARGDCPGLEVEGRFVDDPVQLSVLSVHGAARGVESRFDAYRQWFGDRLVTFACQGEEVLDYRELSFRYEDECAWHRPVELRVGGRPIGEGASPRVLGFVEAPGPPTSSR